MGKQRRRACRRGAQQRKQAAADKVLAEAEAVKALALAEFKAKEAAEAKKKSDEAKKRAASRARAKKVSEAKTEKKSVEVHAPEAKSSKFTKAKKEE